MAFTWEITLTKKSEEIRRYCERGWHVFLVHGVVDDQCTCGTVDCKDAGKHPVASNGIHSATDDADWVISVLATNPNYNLAIAMGRLSGLIDLDLDSAEAIEEAKKLGGIDDTLSFESGRLETGRHCLFKYPVIRDDHRVKNAVEIGKKMDVRADGGYAVVPPSLHVSGRTYRWTNPPELFDLQPVPKWLWDRLVFDPIDPVHVPEDTSPIVEGGRNDYLFRRAAKLRADSLSIEAIRGAIAGENKARCEPPLTDDEVSAIVNSALSYEPGHTGAFADKQVEVEEYFGVPITQLPSILLDAPLTDSGNAECLVEMFGDEFRSGRGIVTSRAESKKIMRWNGHVWEEDLGRKFRDRAKMTARARGAVSSLAPDKDARARLRAWAVSSESLNKLEATCELASTSEKLETDPNTWDSHPMKLAVQNGVIDLFTGVVTDPDPDDYLTQVAAVSYDPEATCPIWEKTVTEIFADKPEVVPYIQRVLGYMLTGLTSEHVMWFWFGNGANGKSTIINVFTHMLGEMGASTPFTMFDSRSENERGDDLASLRGKRFVAATEGEQSRRIAEAKIKSVVSDDKIRCRHMYGSWFEYKPAWKLVLATNHLPEIKGTDQGIWRRIHLLEFSQEFEGERRDRGLEAKLRKEMSGILNWCLVGLKDYLERGGLDAPSVVLRSTEEMREENDMIKQWFEMRVSTAPGEKMGKDEAFLDYRATCRDAGEYWISKPTWARRLKKLGIEFTRKDEQKEYAAEGWEIVSGGYD